MSYEMEKKEGVWVEPQILIKGFKHNSVKSMDIARVSSQVIVTCGYNCKSLR